MYGYKFRNCDGNMVLNRYGSRVVNTPGPIVLFKSREDLLRYTGSNRRDVEVVEFKKLWGLWHKDRKIWDSDYRTITFAENLFETQAIAEKYCPKGFEVREFLQYIDSLKENNMSNSSSPLKDFLQRHLTDAIGKLDWDFGQAKEYTISHPMATSSGVISAPSLTVTPPRSAEELVQRALDECNFNEDFLFDYILVGAGQDAKFPLDFFGESDADAFIITREGRIPERCIDGEEIFVPTFKIANAVDWNLDYKRDRRTDILTRAVKLFAQGYIDKVVSEQNRIVGACTAGKKIGRGQGVRSAVWDMMAKMKAQHRELTDVFVSPEAYADLVNDDDLKKFLLTRDAELDHTGTKLFGVKVHVEPERVDEMENTFYDSHDVYLRNSACEWRNTKENVWQKIVRLMTFAPRAQEFAVWRKPLIFGFDKREGHDDSLIMPFRSELESIFNDPALTRGQREGIYGWIEIGCAALNSKAVIAEAYAPGIEQINFTRDLETAWSRTGQFVLPLKRSGGWKSWVGRWW